MKKAIRVSIVVALGVVLYIGCYNVWNESSAGLYLSEEDYKKIEGMNRRLTSFAEKHKDALNEMSEYFLDAVEDVSDYEDVEKLPDIDALAAELTDEESQVILKTLRPYYTDYSNEEYLFKRVYYSYGGHKGHNFRIVYLDADGEMLEEFLLSRDFCWKLQQIDEHLYVVEESFPYT